jgi:hypothetical protein
MLKTVDLDEVIASLALLKNSSLTKPPAHPMKDYGSFVSAPLPS